MVEKITYDGDVITVHLEATAEWSFHVWWWVKNPMGTPAQTDGKSVTVRARNADMAFELAIIAARKLFVEIHGEDRVLCMHMIASFVVPWETIL
jgi:hypothetical protein